MDILDSIKESIDNNPNLDKSIKTKLFELIIIFHNKFPDIQLDRFNELVKTVKIGRIGKYESLGTSFYNLRENEMLFSDSRIKSLDYDLDNLFMRIVLTMITSNGNFTGFGENEDLKAINSSYEEILANYLVGSSEISDQEEEMIITNTLGNIIGNDKLFDAYFSNNGKMITDSLDQIMSDNKLISKIQHFSSAKKEGSITPSEYANILIDIAKMIDSAILKGFIKDANVLENIDALYPNSSNGYNSINHQGLEVPKEMIRELMTKYGLVKDAKDSSKSRIIRQ